MPTQDIEPLRPDRLKHLEPLLQKAARWAADHAEALKASAELGSPVVELHTGAWCAARERGDAAKADHEFDRLRDAAAQTAALGLECHAGHGLDYETTRLIAALPQIVELNIGHFLVGEAIFVGLAEAVKAMRAAMAEGRGPFSSSQ